MNPQNTVDTLKAMRFSAMANEFERQLSDLASYGQLGFEDRFALLVDAEWNRRQQNKCYSSADTKAPAVTETDTVTVGGMNLRCETGATITPPEKQPVNRRIYF